MIEYVDSNVNWNTHLSAVSTKVSRVIGYLHKLKYVFPSYIFRMIYDCLILLYSNYSLLALGCKCQIIKKLQKKQSGLCILNRLLLTQNQF